MRHAQYFLTAVVLLSGMMLNSCTDDPGPDISGRVLLADGTPAAGVEVMIAYYLERLENPGPSPHFEPEPAAGMTQFHRKESLAAEWRLAGDAFTPATFDTNRIYQPIPNPSCDGFQTIRFELADSASVTMFARSLHGPTDYDLLFMQPYPPGHHQLNYQMVPGLYEINVTFLPDTLVSFIVPELVKLDWDRGHELTQCAGMSGFPAEKIDITDDKGRFSVNRADLIWRPRIFRVTGTDDAAHRLGLTAALYARPLSDSGNEPVPAAMFREIDLAEAGHHVELTVAGW